MEKERYKGKRFKFPAPVEFFYIAHKKNLKSILKEGILSHNKAKEANLLENEISNSEVMERRKLKKVNNVPLWDYANVYWRVTNAMLFTVIKKIGAENVVILGIDKDILEIPETFVTDKNAACLDALEYPATEYYKVLKKIIKPLSYEYWTEGENKQEVMAEVLVRNKILPAYIRKIFVPNKEMAKEIKEKCEINEKNFPIVVFPERFFQPSRKERITSNIELVQGDMFYSEMQTITVSVNTVGVMGAGLASRAKNQYPDVFNEYTRALREGKLKMGIPHLYQRPDNLENPLIYKEDLEEDQQIKSHWFLIFATKNEWWHNSDKEGIERGLQYLSDHYKEWGITSLALPALGCGLGKLTWEEIKPMMIRYLEKMDIPIEIYTPN